MAGDLKNIKQIIVLSGKRFCGKDYVGEIMANEFKKLYNVDAIYAQPSTEIKKQFAKLRQLDFEKLQNDRNYKEIYRDKMTEFSKEQMEKHGDNYYNRLFVQNVFANTIVPTIYIVPSRFMFEIELYKLLNIPMTLIRINTKDSVKKNRGWIYDASIDMDISEIALDGYRKWDYIFDNNEDGYKSILKFIHSLDIIVYQP